VLAKAAHEPDVVLLVVGARGHGGVAGLLLGSVSHSLTHSSTKPLVIVPQDWRARPPSDVRPRIVVGVDGSRPADNALRWAGRRGRHAGMPARGGDGLAVTGAAHLYVKQA
jgi:nucleotide-binding universal stress UspA family protein